MRRVPSYNSFRKINITSNQIYQHHKKFAITTIAEYKTFMLSVYLVKLSDTDKIQL